MTDIPFGSFPGRQAFAPSYLQEGHTLASWLFTTDHKRIAILFAASITFFFFIGGAAATLMRLELVTPYANFLSPDEYNRLFTLHGVVMVWFFLIPSIPTVMGNFLIPMMIGARDVAFPRLNILSWWVFTIGAAFTVYSLIAGGVDTGWTFYTPFSTMFSNSRVFAAAAGVFITGFSSIATGVNFITTIHTGRTEGMHWFRLPLFVWAIYAVSIVMVLATPVLASALLMIMCERMLHLPIFNPDTGGDPLLFQHIFWFYSHPAVYIMVLPAMGVVSEIIACFARRSIFGYRFMVYAMIGIAGIGFFVWGHHMFVAGMSNYASLVFSFLSFIVAVPSAIKVFNWTASLYRGRITFEAPMLYAFGFVGLFTIGGLTGLFVAMIPIDVHVTDTYFVVAHFHYIMVGGSVSAFFAGLHYWWPKATGRLYHEGAARLAAIMMFFGFNFTFFPQFIMGYAGMPRRYEVYPQVFQTWHVMSSAGASVLAVAYVMPLIYFGWSLVYGRRSPPNPWRATGLEWRTSSPPPKDNFIVPPRVEHPPYYYHAEQDPGDLAEIDTGR